MNRFTLRYDNGEEYMYVDTKSTIDELNKAVNSFKEQNEKTILWEWLEDNLEKCITTCLDGTPSTGVQNL